MTWHGQINRTIWEISESLKKTPESPRQRRELLRAHFLQHFEYDKSLHIARDEDGMIYRRQGQQARFIGAAVTMWAGFDMKPHNIMDNTPFFPEIK